MDNGTGRRAEKLEAAHAALVEAVESLTSGEDWSRMLAVASRFHHYSARNVFLIMVQRPDATRVAGYRTWQSLGRQVRKGERGLVILAPCTCRYEVENDDGTTSKHVGIRGFTTTHVFDISQTDGADLPEVAPTLLDGPGIAGAWDRLAGLVKSHGFTLERGDCNGANGLTDMVVRTVRVREDVSPAQALKTLAHELAHVYLHRDTSEYFTCRGRCEVEAESVAYLVCQALGLASDEYSFPYVARWADGKAEVVQETAGRVIETAHHILEALNVSEAAVG